MLSNIFTPDVIDVLIKLSVPIISTVIVNLGVKAFNRFMDYKIEKLEVDGAAQEELARLNNIKIDQYEQEKIQGIVDDGLRFAQEVSYRTWLDPNVKEKTGDEKFNIAKDYAIEVIKKEFTDPEKRQKYLDMLNQKLISRLPDLRPGLDEQYLKLKLEHLDENGNAPLNSRNPLTRTFNTAKDN